MPRGKPLAKKTATRVAVKPVLRGARELITLMGGDAWESLLDGSFRPTKGAIVRVTPPADATDDQIERARAHLNDLGVAAMRFLPRAHARMLAMQAPKVSDHRKAREVVDQMVADAVSSDRDALTALCTETMDRFGL